MNSPSISPAELRKLMRPYTQRSNIKAWAIFTFDVGIYWSLLICVGYVESIWGKVAISLLLGLVIRLLFIVGHDCCHRSFTSSHKLNRFLGIIGFMPSLHNIDLWELGHNKTHHAFTNYKEKDYVYTPLAPSEYLSLPSLKKYQYQLYRTIFGHLFYYAVEIWFKKMIVPHNNIPGIGNKDCYYLGTASLLLYLFVLHIVLISLSHFSGASFISCWAFGFLLPFLFWNWLMGFVIFQHHTNIYTRWFDDEDEWDYWEVQVGHSTHIRFPKPLNLILHNIMEHTAHHSNMMVPLYNLPKAQEHIERLYGEKVQVINWSWVFYWNSIRSCKLYDYQSHRWLGFK